MFNPTPGEMYYDTLHGLLVMTELHEPIKHKYKECNVIGKAEYLNRTGSEVIITDYKDYRIATDSDVIEYLLNNMCCHDIGNGNKISIHIEAVYISNKDEWISLTPIEAFELKAILNREIL
jgi:hypothetical protein